MSLVSEDVQERVCNVFLSFPVFVTQHALRQKDIYKETGFPQLAEVFGTSAGARLVNACQSRSLVSNEHCPR